jgi:hypothetical protein
MLNTSFTSDSFHWDVDLKRLFGRRHVKAPGEFDFVRFQGSVSVVGMVYGDARKGDPDFLGGPGG